MLVLQLMYTANILVAGYIAIISVFFPATAATTIFSNAYPATEVIRLVGCLWLAIALLSLFGLFRPYQFSPVLLVQLIYKTTWLLVVVVPAIRNKHPYPEAMAAFFLVWVLILPFVLPWSYWLK